MTLTSWELHRRYFMNVILQLFEFFKQCLELWPILLLGQVQIEWTITRREPRYSTTSVDDISHRTQVLMT